MDAERREQRRHGRTEQTWRKFLHEVEHEAGVNLDTAERAAVYALEVLESRLLPDEARDLNAQLPSGLVELLPRLPRRPERLHHDQFISRLAAKLGLEASESERLARCVFAVVSRHVAEGELEDVLRELPAELRVLWPERLVADVARHEAQDRFRAERERGEHLPG
ncbi:MAG: hypothetical protein RL653_2563 [Pseudomonadota bacterium]|jgi:uncharacterized protein (DUF2267 family)